ncbi:MAG: leucine-rich repeat protein [Sodaliphilus sp.]
MILRIAFLLRKIGMAIGLLIITSALPARAQSEFYDEFYEDDSDYQEWLLKFEYSNDLNGYIVSPNKSGVGENQDWDHANVLHVPSIRLLDGKPVVALSGFGSLKWLFDITFPEDCHVKYICDGCFEYCTGLGLNYEALNLPESVETIGDYAFYGCSGLKVLTLSSNLNTIGQYAFCGCSSLTELTLPPNLNTIGKCAFNGCTGLCSIVLPKSLKVLRSFAFQNCTALESVVFEDSINFYADNGFYGFENSVFAGCTSLKSVKLPKNTPGNFEIPGFTFYECSSLKSIEFPANTFRLNYASFSHTGLESLDFTTITSPVCWLSYYYTFSSCPNLKTVVANSNLKFDSSALYTFQNCQALESVTINGSGDDYTVICPDAFRFCPNLESVKVYRLKGSGLDNEMDSVFVGCTKLREFISVCSPEISRFGYSCFDGCTSLETVTLPEQEYVVCETAFRDCAALKSFDFTNVTSIGKGSFKGCVALDSVPNISEVGIINESAFEGCSSLPSLKFGNLTSIGSKAFTGCNALASISFKPSPNDPPAVANADAFDAWHYQNTELTVPDEKYSLFATDTIWSKFLGLKHPAMFAYSEVPGGYAITKAPYALDSDFAGMLEIPAQYNAANVVAIADSAFTDLTDLTGVTFPKNLASIGANAFSGCSSIQTVINQRPDPISGDACPDNIFDTEIYGLGTLYVPFGSYDAYALPAPWANFNQNIKQGFGERTLLAPEASREPGVFTKSFELAFTNPNESGTIYYYIVGEGDAENAVREVSTYSAPIAIDATCKVVAYVSDSTACCEPVPFEYTYTVPTGITDVAPAARIYAAPGSIQVSADAPTPIAVYAINGQLITKLEATTATIPVAPGFYIIKAGPQTQKIAVK